MWPPSGPSAASAARSLRTRPQRRPPTHSVSSRPVCGPRDRKGRVGVPHDDLDRVTGDPQVEQHRAGGALVGVGDQFTDNQLGVRSMLRDGQAVRPVMQQLKLATALTETARRRIRRAVMEDGG